MREARFYEKIDGNMVRCKLCPHQCLISNGKKGLCGIRYAQEGRLFTIGYGNLSSAHVDPIEKKPLYHFFPGSYIFSIGGWGCNFKCKFCQNWTISQQIKQTASIIPPEKVVEEASFNSIGIAYTYNEPFINMEYLLDCSILAKKQKLVNVAVTNGFLLPQPLDEILPLLDALNIDIKSIEDKFYREQCGGKLGPVLDFIKKCVTARKHVAVSYTHLTLPTIYSV